MLNMGQLEREVRFLVEQNYEHVRRPGFRLGRATLLTAISHLISESQEMLDELVIDELGVDRDGRERDKEIDIGTWDAMRRDRLRSELADVLGVVTHLALMLELPLDSLADLCLTQLRQNFHCPPED